MNSTSHRYLSMVEEALPQYVYTVSDGQSAVRDAMLYSLKNGGKRVRPILVLAFCESCGGIAADALPFACAVEMIHTYSLIHDDLPCMDNDDVRRGKPACHKQFDEATALLAGDALLTLSFETLTKADTLSPALQMQAVHTLASLSGYAGMIGGQVIDLFYENKAADFEILSCIDRLKTGALIQSAAVLGCLAAGKTQPEILDAAKRYAENIGLAFQIVDDILDVTADASTLGKPVGSDAKNQKSTFVKLLGLEKCKALAEELTETAVAALQALPYDTSFLADFAHALAVRKM